MRAPASRSRTAPASSSACASTKPRATSRATGRCSCTPRGRTTCSSVRARGIQRPPGPAATPPSGIAPSTPTPPASRTPPSGSGPPHQHHGLPQFRRRILRALLQHHGQPQRRGRHHAGQNQTTGSDNIYLANIGVAEESGRIRIGTELTHTATFIAGIHGTNVGGTALPVIVNTNGQLGTGGGSQTPVDRGRRRRRATQSTILAALRSSGSSRGEGDKRSRFRTPRGRRLDSASESDFDWSGATRLTAASLGINLNSSGSSLGELLQPRNLHTNMRSTTTPGVAERHDVGIPLHRMTGRSTSTVANAGSGPGEFLADDVITVEDAGDGRSGAESDDRGDRPGANADITSTGATPLIRRATRRRTATPRGAERDYGDELHRDVRCRP